MKTEHVQIQGDILLVNVFDTKTKDDRSFVISGQFRDIVLKYMAMRPPHVTHDRFFINFLQGKCTTQAIGKHKFSGMPRRIAAFLTFFY